MINRILAMLVRLLLSLRYRVTTRGLDVIAEGGRTGILFLPNHPALIDPIILMSRLLVRFAPRTLADRRQVDRFFIRRLARRAGVIPMADASQDGRGAAGEIQARVAQCAELLKAGQNVMLYPAGRVYRKRLEDLGGNSAVETILRLAPDARVVLVRTRGLWGSGFGWASGREPNIAAVLKTGFWRIIANAIFFMPRRRVEIDFVEPVDLPRKAARTEINRYLEDFYNADARPNTFVPFYWWKPGSVTLPEPLPPAGQADASDVPPEIRTSVLTHLRDLSGRETMADSDRLDADLGLDSLSRMDLAVWLEKEFSLHRASATGVETVGDVLLAAAGLASGPGAVHLNPPPAKWFVPASPEGGRPERLTLPDGKTIVDVFLAQARRDPLRLVLADQRSGARSYRDLMRGVLLLWPALARIDGEYLGIMLPASVGAAVAYLSAVTAGKTPVMVNWTTGLSQMRLSLSRLGVQCVLTSKLLVQRLAQEGEDISRLGITPIYIEDIVSSAGLLTKLRVLVQSAWPWPFLRGKPTRELAVVLFTSGSEAQPKAVGLSHANILANIRDVLAVIDIRSDDCLLAMLPPFHSFGLTVGTVLPLCTGIRTCYHANPLEGGALAAMIETYRATLLVGTPTFLEGIARRASGNQLASLRYAVTGAEKCSPRVHETLAGMAKGIKVLEGYGITECSPIVAVNDQFNPVPGTIGKVLPSFEHCLVRADATMDSLSEADLVPEGQEGLLLVRGPSVFAGYLGYEGTQPFVHLAGKSWYWTGDVVRPGEGGVLVFVGRRKRFIKLGGEMLSLPAIESALEAHYPPQMEEEGRPAQARVAIAATEAERPVVVLFTTLDLTREDVNAKIEQAGLSPLHFVRRIVRVERIPQLGTGKTDYRTLQQGLGQAKE